MKFIILKKNLKNGLRAIERISGENAALPILKNFLIESIDNKIKLSATNLELAVTSFISGKIIENGSLTIPLNIFNSIINNIQNEKINLEADNNKLLIKTDNYQATIQGIKKEEFPIIPKIENIKTYLEIPGLILKDSLLSVVDSLGSETKPELNGVLFDFQTTVLKLAATDSFRLSEKTIFNTQFESNFDKNFKIIIPNKTIQEIIKELQINESVEMEKVFIYLDPNQIFLKNESVEIISRLINGDFPDYSQIIPKETEVELILNREELISAVKLTGIFTDRLSEIKIFIKDNGKNIEVSSVNQGLGENKYLIPAKVKGSIKSSFEVSFNWRYLLDGIKNIKSEEILLGLNNSNKPCLIKSPDDISLFYILMPIKS